jgi:hypothetical protein
MLKKILAPALGAIALSATVLPSAAQVPAPQVAQACLRLESQLATLDSQNVADPQQQALEASYNQQRANVDAMIAKSRGMGCGRNFLFGPRPPAECRGLEAQIDKQRTSVDRLESQLKRGNGDAGLREARRRDLIAALAQYQCGPQYQAAAPQEPQRGGLFGLLFGNRGGGGGGGGGVHEQYPGGPAELPQSSTFRTVCARTCDGFFFPVSFSTVPARFGQDENICRRTCPGTEAIMFSYPNPGGTIEQATSPSGQAYKDLPNAFKYQTEFVKDCSCRPANMSWAQALANAEDDTVQRGDIVVDEERARAMSLPKGTGNVRATPDEAARAAQDSATTVTNEGVVEGPANTDPPAGFSQPPAQDTGERTAVPYYVPPPPRPREPVYVPPQFR